jgi:hypothetical protein
MQRNHFKNVHENLKEYCQSGHGVSLEKSISQSDITALYCFGTNVDDSFHLKNRETNEKPEYFLRFVP